VGRFEGHKPYSIVVVAEGIHKPEKGTVASYLAETIEAITGIETRQTVLGYIQRGGSPSPFDRVLATRYGAFAAQCIAEENFGTMAAIIDNKTVAVPLSEVGGKTRLVDPDHPLVVIARRMGISFGDQ
jgi:6-phosphofructokinase 1